MSEPIGHWTTLGTAASVDWCEPNYVHSLFIAEWWNTLSCMPMIALGCYGAWLAHRNALVERRFFICFLTLALVGIGSIAFHGSILKIAQAMDELPMTYGGLALAYCMANRSHTDRSRTRRWQLGLTLYATIFTGAYFTLEDYFSFFITSYAVVVAILVIAGIRISWGPDGSPTHRRLLLASAGLFVGSVFLLWFPEHVWFDCEHPVQKLQLHALWHLGAGLGTYLGFLCVLWDRLQQRQLNPQLALRSWLRIPTVTPGKQD